MSGSNDDTEIPLVVTLGDSAGQLQLLTDRIAQAVEEANKLLGAFDRVPGGAKGFQAVVAQVSLLQKALATPSAEVGLLNAVTRGARATAAAVKEIDTQKLVSDARGIANAIRAIDPARVRQGIDANNRIIAETRLQIARLEQLAGQAQAAEATIFQNQLLGMERKLADAVRREVAANNRLAELQEASRIRNRQQSVRDTAVFRSTTPEGQYQVARAEADYQNADIDRATRAAARQKRQAEAAANSEYSASYSEAAYTNRDRNAASDATRRAADYDNQNQNIQFGNAYSLANRENQDRDRIARQAEAAKSADYSAAYSVAQRENRDQDYKYLNDWKLAHEQNATTDRKWLNDYALASRENRDRDIQARRNQGPNDPTGQQYRDLHYNRLFGDGGAALFETQARLLINYAAMNAVFQGFHEGAKAVLEFDVALHEFSAITGSTNAQAAELGKTILAISTNSKFSSKELADAAVEMAKSGLTIDEVRTVLTNIVTLSTTTGSTLKESTELFVSTMETFKVGTNESSKITEQLVSTLNTSRLSVEKLNTAFQGVGVTAKESGLSFAETSSALAALSNAGLSSGQQLGQGFRQVLTSLNEPSTAFKKRLEELGISISDIDVGSHGLIGVLENLKAGGFSAADAFQVFGARASTAFAGLLNNTEAYKAQYQIILQATGAIGAQNVALDTLEGSWQKLQHTLTNLLIGASSTVLGGLKGLTGGLASVTSGVDANATTWKILFTILTGTGLAVAGRSLLTLASNLRVVREATTLATAAFNSMTGATTATSVASAALSGVVKSFGITMVAGLGIAAVIALISEMGAKEAALAKAADAARESENAAKNALAEKGKTLETVNDFLDSAIARSAHLKSDQAALNDVVTEAKNRFGNLTTALDGAIPSYDALIGKVLQLRREMAAASGVDLQNYITSLTKSAAIAKDQIERKSGEAGLKEFLRGQGQYRDPQIDPYTGRNIPESATTLAEASYNYSGNNTAAQHALAFIGGTGQTQQQASEVLRGLNDPTNGLDKGKKDALIAAVQDLTAHLSAIASSNLNLGLAHDQERVQDIQNTPAYQRLELQATQVQAVLAGRTGASTGSVADRQSSLGIINGAVEPVLAQINELRASYTDRKDLEAFDNSDLGKIRETISGKLREIQGSVKNFVADVAVRTATLDIADLNKQISELQAENAHEKGTDTATKEKLKALATQRRDLQKQQAQEELDKELKSAPPDSALRDPAYRAKYLASKTSQADSEYQATVNRTDYAGGRGGRRDPNFPISLPAQNFAGEIDKRLALIDTNANTDLKDAETPLKAQQAFLNAASENGEFPQAAIDLKKQQLNQTKIGVSDKQLQVRLAQLQALQDLEATAGAAVQKNVDDFQAVASKYGVKVSADGTIDQSTLNFASTGLGGQQRAEFKKAYDDYIKNLSSIPDTMAKIKAQIESVNTDITGLQATGDARKQVSEGTFSDAFTAASSHFSDKSGANDSTYKVETDTLSKTFDSLSTHTANFFDQLATGSTKGKNVFKDFVSSVLADAAKMLSQKATSSLFSYLFDAGKAGISALFGGGDTPAGDDSFGDGGLYPADTGFYNGGIVVGHPGSGSAMPHFYVGGIVPPRKESDAPPREANYKVPHHSHSTKHLYNGGMALKHFDWGGIVPGVHIGRDSVPSMLAPGEGVLNRSAVSLIGSDMVDAMNSGAVRRAKGMPTMPAPKEPDMVNVYVVDKSVPQPVPGPKEILAMIGEDVMSNGQTKKLIKQVALGNI